MASDFKKDRVALSSEVRDTYDDMLQHLFDGTVPKRSVRLDVVQACVEVTDFLVKLLAHSRFCLFAPTDAEQNTDYKAHCKRNCERCIRSHVYKALDHKKAALTAKENKP